MTPRRLTALGNAHQDGQADVSAAARMCQCHALHDQRLTPRRMRDEE
ncbi:MAG: hypothetical protein AAFO95_16590 [Cyanobacteria bacterium J06600_6]